MADSEKASAPDSHDGETTPPWAGYWRVRRYDGSAPSVPTYYDATPERWDVIKETSPGGEDAGQHVARHPILEVRTGTIILKDEGAGDEEAEKWRVETDGDWVRVVAVTGPHAGVVGVAERIQTDPRGRAA